MTKKATVIVTYKPALGKAPFVVTEVTGTTQYLPGQYLTEATVDSINRNNRFNPVKIKA